MMNTCDKTCQRRLKANSDKKNEILGRLFDNSAFKRYQELLNGAKGMLYDQRRNNEEKLKGLIEDGFPEEERVNHHPESPDFLEKLEQLVMRLEGVRECMVYEEDNRLTVKIVPGDMEEGFFEGGTEKYFREKVYQMNRELPPYEQISRIRICDRLEKNAAGKKIRINHGISADHL